MNDSQTAMDDSQTAAEPAQGASVGDHKRGRKKRKRGRQDLAGLSAAELEAKVVEALRAATKPATVRKLCKKMGSSMCSSDIESVKSVFENVLGPQKRAQMVLPKGVVAGTQEMSDDLVRWRLVDLSAIALEEEKKVVLNRRRRVAVAVPASTVANAQTLELQTALVGRIARALVVFNVDEIFVFDDYKSTERHDDASWELGFLSRALRYLETPQYLRKALFTQHRDLASIGMVPPLDAPHHMRRDAREKFREGFVVPKGRGVVDVGLFRNVQLIGNDDHVEGERVTCEIVDFENPRGASLAKIVSRNVAREAHPNWGYEVCECKDLKSVLEAARKKGYERIVGTSEHGTVVTSAIARDESCLIVFGGPKGLESSCVEEAVESLFDEYVNFLPRQGSRTIRSEEALLIGLAKLL